MSAILFLLHNEKWYWISQSRVQYHFSEYKTKCDIYFIIYLLCHPWSYLSKQINSDFESFEKLRNFEIFWNSLKISEKFSIFEKFRKFQKCLKYLANLKYFPKIWTILGSLEKFGKFRKVLKISKISNNFNENNLLKDDITRGNSQFPLLESWDYPFTKMILHGCMNDIQQLCCITYIYWSHDWIWPIWLQISQQVYNNILSLMWFNLISYL